MTYAASTSFHRFVLSCTAAVTAMVLIVGCGEADQQPPISPVADSVASRLITEDLSTEQQEELISANITHGVDLVRGLTRGMESGTEQEVDRIPLIWRVSISIGTRNEDDQLRRLLQVSLPALNSQLQRWEAVVIGGGVINGISRNDQWPRSRVRQLLVGHSELQERWDQAIHQSVAMAHDTTIANPTRYDALRMIAMGDWEDYGDDLTRYLTADVNETLQMGAVSGLSDMRSPEAMDALLKHYDAYTERNRGLALDALMRTEQRMKRLLDAVADGTIPRAHLGERRIEELKSVDNPEIRKEAQQVLG